MGAGLLAKAVSQLASMLNVKPLSRASPLPQGVVVDSYSRDSTPNSSHTDSARWNVALAAGMPQ
ncbi:hypothetical protein F7R14_07140 [Pseudomonas lini]|uniref:Uncharacterized protein n=1 Tax=Pseudomonas lini TaxID=163011 RepID=A0A7V7P5G0_9PSED|nr:hypothetical protein F7R14_07140 [Pseudomonas lini]